MALTDGQLKKLLNKKHPQAIELTDGHGLGSRVSVNGVINFQYRYKWAGKPVRYGIGQYPGISLASARQRAMSLRTLISDGIDPRNEKAEKCHSVTLQDVFDYWLRNYANSNLKSTQNARSLFAHCRRIARKNYESLTTPQFVGVFDEMRERGIAVSAGLLLTLLKQVMAFARVREYASNQCLQDVIIKHIGKRPKVGSRVLTDKEITEFFEALRSSRISERYKLFFELIYRIPCRLSEIRLATHHHFDFDAMVWTVPEKISKTNMEIRRPIPPGSVQPLQRLIEISRGREFFYSHKNGRIITPQAVSATCTRLKKHLSFDDWKIHDIRRTVATKLAELEQPQYVIEKLLGHKMGGVMAVYNKHDYLESQRESIAVWENKLHMLISSTLAAN